MIFDMRKSRARRRRTGVERRTALVYNCLNNSASLLAKGVNPVANQTGKRYNCAKCGSEFIVTKGGEGTVICCSEPMQQK